MIQIMRHHFAHIPFALGIAFLCSCSSANDTAQIANGISAEDGIRSLAQGKVDYDATYRAAELGDSMAQYELGLYIIDQTHLVERDILTALEESEKIRALMASPLLSDNGIRALKLKLENVLRAVEKLKNHKFEDIAVAAAWIRKSSNNGNPRAQYTLGLFHLEGYGVQKDYVQAFELFKNLAYRGHVQAQIKLAACYENGIGIAPDLVQAYAFYNLSLSGAGWARQKLTELEKIMQPDEILKAQSRTQVIRSAISDLDGAVQDRHRPKVTDDASRQGA
jgi:TPR repeat protein